MNRIYTSGLFACIALSFGSPPEASAQGFFDKIKKSIDQQVKTPPQLTKPPQGNSKPNQQYNNNRNPYPQQYNTAPGNLGVSIPPGGQAPPPAPGGYKPIDFYSGPPPGVPGQFQGGGYIPPSKPGDILIQTNPDSGYSLGGNASGGRKPAPYGSNRRPKRLSEIKGVKQTSGRNGQQLGRTAPGIPTGR